MTQRVVVDGVGVTLNGPFVEVATKLMPYGWFLGQLDKSQARRFRKAFYKAGWYKAAASRRLTSPPYILHVFKPLIIELEDEDGQEGVRSQEAQV